MKEFGYTIEKGEEGKKAKKQHMKILSVGHTAIIIRGREKRGYKSAKEMIEKKTKRKNDKRSHK